MHYPSNREGGGGRTDLVCGFLKNHFYALWQTGCKGEWVRVTTSEEATGINPGIDDGGQDQEWEQQEWSHRVTLQDTLGRWSL